MSKLSRREFLKITEALAVSGALAWTGYKINDSPVVSIDDDDNVLQEQPFAPYCLDPDSEMLKPRKFQG